MPTREQQRSATRARILEAATRLLVERGYAGWSTLAVQHAAGLSRGALLHHFPTLDTLTAALVEHLVELNEHAAQQAAAAPGASADPIERTLTALLETMTRPAARAEQELWAAARTDPTLAAVLRESERRAGRDLHRVIDTLFGPELTAHPRYPAIRDLTITLLRGVTAARPLRTGAHGETRTLGYWADTIRTLIEADAGPG
ncbi:TetR/AcrR family transcriptional regulator [Nocardia cyriacigeorgica]|uniref:TetR/AcrR family transcriptional regulator n=1 Tax=Nocardia cyriacigeorgica TaxID=135487 RepID=UPI00189363BC|nr:TetR/AcrR family transcriptional regulator [Nocardia cyriacigeorgica]MBF6440299.1 TetR/AcrR family transcriptional regulator [Nocardia cyriacigeorgica]MBF6457105.1 TetR/AcrR family transcriptional regulator [Nocardia cyriacigeorgica]MBF6481014.1 TetR/AcrR family transcriptional regulator [Nocardia cyriacigeorgica]MBF6554234.1 TetR/AcrR family transcriptional regulator [Nocardia cyriacigeorgica]